MIAFGSVLGCPAQPIRGEVFEPDVLRGAAGETIPPRPGHWRGMSHLSAAQAAQINNRDDNGRWQQKAHSDVEDTAGVLGVPEMSNPVPESGTEYAQRFEHEASRWSSTIHLDIDEGPGRREVSAVHHPNMGEEISFTVQSHEQDPAESRWQWSIDGEPVAEGRLEDDDDIARAEMYQQSFLGQAKDDDALEEGFVSLNTELDPKGCTVSPAGGDFFDDHTEERTLRIDQPDGYAVEIHQWRHDPRLADLSGALDDYQAQRGHTDYRTEYRVDRISPEDEPFEIDLSGQFPIHRHRKSEPSSYESMDQAIAAARERTGNFGTAD